LAAKFLLDKRKLSADYASAQRSLAELDHELTETRSIAQEQSTELDRLQTRLADAQQEVQRLQFEQRGFRQANANLLQQLASVSEEKVLLEAKMQSIRELKVAIRNVKQQMWAKRRQEWLAKVDAQRAEDEHRLAMGNRGYLVRDGMTTLKSATKMQVRVLDPESQ
jgi:chromosome segregation ATPase